jgi:hypothetical protein
VLAIRLYKTDYLPAISLIGLGSLRLTRCPKALFRVLPLNFTEEKNFVGSFPIDSFRKRERK